MRKLVKPLRHGQITIPKEFREALGLSEDDMLSVELIDGKLQIEPVKVEPRGKGSPWAKELYDRFAPVREAARELTEGEVNEAIDEAVDEVRSRRE